MTYHGNEGEVQVGANAVLELDGWNWTNTGEWADDSAAGDEFRTRKAGKKDGSGTINVLYDPGDTTGQMALTPGATATVTLYPSGTSSGRGRLTGTIYVESVGVETQQDDICKRTISATGYLLEDTVTP